MQTSLDLLKERLLQGGVRPRLARRYLAELQDHLDDLVAEERQVAGGEQAARSRALARLGSVETLADAMIARRELRSWSSKAPVAAYLIGPPLALAACTALALAGVVGTCTWLKGGGAPVDLPDWLGSLAAGVVVFNNNALPVLLGWTLGAMAIRQRAAPFWPALGIVVLAVVGAVIQVDLTLPSRTAHGEIELAASFGSASQWASFAGRLGLSLLLTLTPYAGFRLWRSSGQMRFADGGRP